MKHAKLIWKLVFSISALILTIAGIYLAEIFLNFEIGQNGSFKLVAQILIFTFGVYWIFALTRNTIRQNAYFVLGFLMVLTVIYYIALNTLTINIPEIALISNLHTFEVLSLIASGVYLLTMGWLLSNSHLAIKFRRAQKA